MIDTSKKGADRPLTTGSYDNNDNTHEGIKTMNQLHGTIFTKKSSQFGRKYPQWREPLAAFRKQNQLRRITPEELVCYLKMIFHMAPGMSGASTMAKFLSFVLYLK